MALKTHITDSGSGLHAAVVDGEEQNALVVATRELKTYTPKSIFFTNPTYGREMAQNGAFGGTPLIIHNGTDDVAWTMSEPVGTKWVADNAAQFYAGTKSLYCDNPSVGAIMQVINNLGPGNNLDMTGNRVALTMWIRVGSDWTAGDSFSIYAMVDGAQVGDKVYLEDYFNFTHYDAWQFINIPLTDMSLEAATLDAFRIQTEARAGAKSPTFWIDNLILQESGAPIKFAIEPSKGTWLHVSSFQTIFVDAYSVDNADSTMPQLSYNKILDMTPAKGYKYEYFSGGLIDNDFTMRFVSLMDLLSCASAEITNAISDGTNTLITVLQKYPQPIVLKAENRDKIVITIEDSFNALLKFRVCAQAKVETR